MGTRGRRWFAGGVALVLGAIGALVPSGAPPPAVAAMAPTAMVVNGTFDANCGGWFASGDVGGLWVTPEGRTGAGCRLAGGTGTKDVAMENYPHSVLSTPASGVYKASAWVKAGRAGVQAEIRLVERTWAGDPKGQVTSGAVTLTDTAWTYISVPGFYTVTAAGNVLDVSILAPKLPAGTTLDVDDISLRTQADPTTHLVQNTGGNVGTWGWESSSTKATLSPYSSGRSGNCARLTVGAESATPGINDKVNSVQPTAAGTAYTASAWVRTSTTQNVTIRLWEWTRAGAQAAAAKTYTKSVAPGVWTQIWVTATAVGTGNSLDLNVYASGAPAGSTLDIDDITLTTGDPTKDVNATWAGWKTDWNDDFTTFDTTKWVRLDNTTYGVDGGEDSCTMASNATVADSKLRIQATKVSSHQCEWGNVEKRGYRIYDTGHIVSKGLKSVRYGRIEVRAKSPIVAGSSRGIWAAFWLLPVKGKSEGGLPGEIDIAEFIEYDTREKIDRSKTVAQTAHHYVGEKPEEKLQYKKSGKHVPLRDGSAPSAEFHVYGVEWDANSIKWYIDDPTIVTHELKNDAEAPWYVDFIDRDYYVRVNIAVGGGGSWPGPPNAATTFPAIYQVDWVRYMVKG